MYIELSFPFFEIKTFGYFPEDERMGIKDYLRAIYGIGEYKVHPDFDWFYPRTKRGVLLHVREIDWRTGSLSQGKLLDYFYIAESIERCMEMLKENHFIKVEKDER